MKQLPTDFMGCKWRPTYTYHHEPIEGRLGWFRRCSVWTNEWYLAWPDGSQVYVRDLRPALSGSAVHKFAPPPDMPLPPHAQADEFFFGVDDLNEGGAA